NAGQHGGRQRGGGQKKRFGKRIHDRPSPPYYEHRARRMVDNLVSGAAHKETTHRAVPIATQDDQVKTTRLGMLDDVLRSVTVAHFAGKLQAVPGGAVGGFDLELVEI